MKIKTNNQKQIRAEKKSLSFSIRPQVAPALNEYFQPACFLLGGI